MVDYYSHIADGYDTLHGAEQEAKLKAFLERVKPSQDSMLLDVGCGTGRSILLLNNVRWHGLEPAPGLIAHATPEAHRHIRQGFAEYIPWPDATFDTVLSLTSLQNFENPEKGLVEMRRVAKPGALVLISFIKKSPKHALLSELIKKTFFVKEEFECNQDLMYVCATQG